MADNGLQVSSSNKHIKINFKLITILIIVCFLLFFYIYFIKNLSNQNTTSNYNPHLKKSDLTFEFDKISYSKLFDALLEFYYVDTPQISEKTKIFDYKIYSVKRGDSIDKIARIHNISSSTILSFNNIKEGNLIMVGQKFLVPNQDGLLYTTQKGDTLEEIASKYRSNGVSIDEIVYYNDLTSNNVAIGQKLFIPKAKMSYKEKLALIELEFCHPVRGRINSGFGWRRDPFTRRLAFHGGIDIRAPKGRGVRAAREGIIEFSGWYGGYGNLVIVRHANGYKTYYGHLSKRYVRKGQYVKKRQLIGAIGSTGRSTGPHLHFELRKYGKKINPTSQKGLRGRLGTYFWGN